MNIFSLNYLFNYYRISTYVWFKNSNTPGDYEMKSGLPACSPTSSRASPPSQLRSLEATGNHLLNWLSFSLSLHQLLASVLKSSRKILCNFDLSDCNIYYSCRFSNNGLFNHLFQSALSALVNVLTLAISFRDEWFIWVFLNNIK